MTRWLGRSVPAALAVAVVALASCQSDDPASTAAPCQVGVGEGADVVLLRSGDDLAASIVDAQGEHHAAASAPLQQVADRGALLVRRTTGGTSLVVVGGTAARRAEVASGTTPASRPLAACDDLGVGIASFDVDGAAGTVSLVDADGKVLAEAPPAPMAANGVAFAVFPQ